MNLAAVETIGRRRDMATIAAMPIEDKMAMSMAVVVGEGITAIQAGVKVLPINKQ